MAISSPSLRSRVVEQRQRVKQHELKKLTETLSMAPIFDAPSPVDAGSSVNESFSNSRADSFLNLSAPDITESPGRVSPVSTKKGRFQKFLGVFSSRPVPSTPMDSSPVNPYPPSPSPDSSSSTSFVLNRAATLPLDKEPMKRKQSIVNRFLFESISTLARSSLRRPVEIESRTPSSSNTAPSDTDEKHSTHSTIGTSIVLIIIEQHFQYASFNQ